MAVNTTRGLHFIGCRCPECSWGTLPPGWGPNTSPLTYEAPQDQQATKRDIDELRKEIRELREMITARQKT